MTLPLCRYVDSVKQALAIYRLALVKSAQCYFGVFLVPNVK